MPEETILGPLSVLGGPETMRVVLNSSSSSLVRVVLNSSSSKPSSLLCRGSRGRAHRRARRCGTRRSWPTSRLSAPRCTRGLDKRRMPARKRERMRKAARADVHDGLRCLPGGWAPHGDTGLAQMLGRRFLFSHILPINGHRPVYVRVVLATPTSIVIVAPVLLWGRVQ